MLALNNRSQRIFNILVFVTLVVGAGLALTPMAYMLSTSFKPNIYTLEVPPQFIPQQPTTENYQVAFGSRNFGRSFLNSMGVALATMALTVTLASMMAYAFARFQFRFKNLIFFTLLAMMTLPAMMLIIPQFILARNLGLTNSLPGLILVYTAGGIAFNTFLLRGFFEALPRELEESALIDGANHLTIFLRIIVPLSTPALSTVAVFSFLGSWDEFTWALTTIQDAHLRTLPITIANFRGVHASNWGLVFAGSVITVIPTLIIFLLFQRYFIQGLTAGAIRG